MDIQKLIYFVNSQQENRNSEGNLVLKGLSYHLKDFWYTKITSTPNTNFLRQSCKFSKPQLKMDLSALRIISQHNFLYSPN